jgi:cytosine/adenosine deaminase-related metal-dependent hydrolase
MRLIPVVLALAACAGADKDLVDPTDITDPTDATDPTDDATDDGPTDDGSDPFPDEEPDPSDEVVTCGEAPAAPEGATCGLSGAGDATVLRGTILGEKVYVGGALRVEDGRITCVGCDCDDAGATVLACGDAVISPGLINAHDHITFNEGAPLDVGSKRYDHRHEWRAELSAPGNSEGVDGTRWGELRQLLAGTTSLVGSGSAPGFLRNLDRSSDAGDGLDAVSIETFPLGDSNRSFKANCAWDYDQSAFALQGDVWVPHVAEGIDDFAKEEFFCQSQPEGGERDFVEPNSAFVHGVGLTTPDYDRMAQARTGLIWSPRSNISLYGQTAQVTLFDRLGGRIALGTDWTYSGSTSMLRELACAASLNEDHFDGHFSDYELWMMATSNPAMMLDQPDLGRLAEGRLADVAVFRAEAGQTYDAVVRALPKDVALVMRAGKPLFGEAALVSGLGEDCEEMDVCGVDSAICTADAGTTWAALSDKLADAYPVFHCDVPADEPTCAPSRPGEYDGITADDQDGDGLSDAEDLCPSVFSPLRPMDGGAQLDNDGDGQGDACDATPLADDLDGDGVANAVDLCPYVENEQVDADNDGRGDTCDACPDRANRVGLCPPDTSTIADLRAGTVDLGATVSVEGVVTAVEEDSFWIQQDQVAGVRVYLGEQPDVSVGDLVRTDGTLDDYFGEMQLAGTFVAVVGPGTTPEPVALSATAAADEAYEGMLVTITSGDVTNAAYDCAVDGGCRDEGLYEIGGASGVVVDPKIYADADWDDRRGDPPPITGVMNFRWERRRLLPRDGADF